MKSPRKYNHVPKDQWVPCAGCGRRVEWGGQLPNGMCAACNDPKTAALCRRIAAREEKWALEPGPSGGRTEISRREREALRRYERRASFGPDAIRMMLDRPSADSGKRGGGPNNGGSE